MMNRKKTEPIGVQMRVREIWRSFVLYGIFVLLLIAGWHELPSGDSILPWYVIVASAAVPAFAARFWR
jgi:hypothetical protein